MDETEIKERARVLFMEETSRHLGWCEELLAKGEPPTLAERVELGRRVHTIKGGAGFFGEASLEREVAGVGIELSRETPDFGLVRVSLRRALDLLTP